MTNVVALQDAKLAWNYTLADAVADINRKFDELDETHRRVAHAQDRLARAKLDRSGLRFAIGDALIEARKMLKEQGDVSFSAWCDANIKRSRRDIYRCIEEAGKISSGQIPGLKAAIKAGALPQEWSGGNGTVGYHHSRSVQTAERIFRKMTHADQLQFVTNLYAEVKALMEEIDRGAS